MPLRPLKDTGKKIFNVERITTTKVYENVTIIAADEFEATTIAKQQAGSLDWMEGSEEETEVEFSAFDDAANAEIARVAAAMAIVAADTK
jgi:hypothetical protein